MFAKGNPLGLFSVIYGVNFKSLKNSEFSRTRTPPPRSAREFLTVVKCTGSNRSSISY